MPVENHFGYQGFLAMRMLAALEEAGVIGFLEKNKKGASVSEMAGELNLKEYILESVCDFVSVNLPLILIKNQDGYALQKGAYAPEFKNKLYFSLAYEPVFANASRLIKGEVEYGKGVRRNDHYLYRSGRLYCEKAWELILEIIKKERTEALIDLGCGDGEFLFQAVKKIPSIKRIGVEAEEAVVKNFKASREDKAEDQIVLFHGDARFPEKWGGFIRDKYRGKKIAIVGSMIWHEFLNKGEEFVVALVSNYRFQFPGGLFIIAEYNGFTWEEIAKFPRESRESAAIYRLAHFLTGQGLPQKPEVWLSLLRKAGLSSIRAINCEPNITIFSAFL